MSSRVRRSFVVWLLGALALAGTARAVALPEACSTDDDAARETTIGAALDWISRNQGDDGRFLYRYDMAADRVEPGYNWVRHAGTMLALAQADNSGYDTDDTFERALDAMSAQLVDSADGARSGVLDGTSVSVGGSALLLVALLERREGGDRDHDALVDRLAGFVSSALTPRVDSGTAATDGSLIVRELADTNLDFVDQRPSPFTSGEAAFALAKLRNSFPESDTAAQVRGILRYLIRHKAEDEGYVPDMADHWAAYAMAEMTRWPGGAAFDDEQVAWARKQMGLASVMVRYESQRTNSGVDRWLRGRTSVGSAVGTHGEMLSGWLIVADREPRLRDHTGGVADRLRCNIGVLVDRQISDDESRGFPDPSRVAGSWSWFDITQVDDQQHAVSALLKGGEVLGAGILERREAVPSSWLLVVIAVIVAFNPPRVARAVKRARSAGRSMVGRTRLLAAYLVPMLLGSTILGWLDTNVPTAIVAAGVTIVLSALTVLPRSDPDQSVGLAALRPELMIFVAAASAGGRGWSILLGLLIALIWSGSLVHRTRDGILIGSARACALVAVAVGVMLIVNGVYAV